MLVSVIVCTHSLDNYQNLLQAVDSLLAQTHREKEIVIVVDSDDEGLNQRMVADYGRQEIVKVVLLKQNQGISAARNAGIGVARGDVIAFIDDDALAERRWLENLVFTYEEFKAMAVGGKILPLWLDRKPDHLPEELYWLVAITPQGFAGWERVGVRNAYGANMSFRREVFQKVGVFNQNFGFARRGASYTQGEEAELALRMRQNLGQGVIYDPEAIVYHKIPPSKVGVKRLLKRAFYQGYSKALLRKLYPAADSMATERAYLKSLLLKYLPQRMRRFYCLPELKKLFLLVAIIIGVALGFAYGYTKRKPGFGKGDGHTC